MSSAKMFRESAQQAVCLFLAAVIVTSSLALGAVYAEILARNAEAALITA